jgi:hypothetical protein
MSLAIIFDQTVPAKQTLSVPPPIKGTLWNRYFDLLPLMSEQHGAAISLLKTEVGPLSQTYDSDLPQDFIDSVFIKGARYMKLLDLEMKRLLEQRGPFVEDYIFAISLLRENLEGTIRYYFRIRGTP